MIDDNTINAPPHKILIDITSLKKTKPIVVDIKSSRYFTGAKNDAGAFEKAFITQKRIRLAPIPSSMNSPSCKKLIFIASFKVFGTNIINIELNKFEKKIIGNIFSLEFNNILFRISNVAKSILDIIKIPDIKENLMFCDERVIILPVKPINVAISISNETFSRRNIIAISIVNIGTVKLMRVTVAIGTNFAP
jgi:hypothetical protein